MMTERMNMDTVQQSIRSAVSESEGRTSHAINQLRDDLNTWRHDFMPHQRIEDRWRRDDERFAEHARDIAALQQAQTHQDMLLQTMATKEDVSAAVKEAVGGFATKADVESIVHNIGKFRLAVWQQIAFIILGLLGFLATTGIIHPLALFTGGR